jgi:Uma2 family endonuclease
MMSTAHRISVAEFDRMVEGSVFGPAQRERIELVAGELRDMNPPGPMHDEIVDRLREWSEEVRRGRKFRVRTEQPIGLVALDSVPYPDLAWVRHRSYAQRRPEPVDILLLVEVADTSLAYDRFQKSALYAAAGIAEYWVVNVQGESVDVFRQPESGKYTDTQKYSRSEELRPLAFPELTLRIARLFEDWIEE